MTINDGGSSTASDPRTLLLATDWSGVDHCCPDQAPETPVILAGLLDDDEDVQRAALCDLGQAVTHQNTIYSATAPAARFVIAVLGHPRTATPGVYFYDERRRPLRAALLTWLGDLADDATYTEEGPGEPEDVAAVRALLPLIHRAAQPYLTDADLMIREAAVHAAAMTLAAPELAVHIPELVPLVRTVLATSDYRGYRYLAQRCLVTWGVEPGPLPNPRTSEPADRSWAGGCDDDPPF
ncbi:hypothetical protein [Streptomyces mangrovisoli]|uniref:HEAT repeat domain-containing protein n=1 Tax=Streptomyces mangrovisoli TaxID=1428628 RepID=A0A1J4NRK1_9ACTN|nr:hypothetical protein [Streptomyces mangrovisoli]OIJ63877.1 hypothetical protein WN71_031185 [Streptomyces mangrovisoli]